MSRVDEFGNLKMSFGFVRGQVVLPDHAQCPDCGYFDTRDPEVRRRIIEAGRLLSDAEPPSWVTCGNERYHQSRRHQERP